LLYWLMARWLVGPLLVRRLAGVYSAVLLGINFTFWSQALIAEVYTLHTVLVLALILTAQWLAPSPLGLHPQPVPVVQGTRLVLLAGLGGLALTHHGMTLLLFPALVVYLALAA